MEKRCYVQNLSKRVVVPELASAHESRAFQKLIGEGRVGASTRHLGGQYSRTGGTREETTERKGAIAAAWTEFGGLGLSDAPKRCKRNVFVGHVQGASLAGLSSYTLLPREKREIDAKCVAMLRCLL